MEEPTLGRRKSLRYLTNTPHFMDLEGSSTHSQAHAAGPYSTSAEPSLRHTIQFILKYILVSPSHRYLGLPNGSFL
jgi:hypothetical protein